MAPWDISNLDVADKVEIVFDRADYVSLDHLRVIYIIKRLNIGLVDTFHNLETIRRSMEKKIWEIYWLRKCCL